MDNKSHTLIRRVGLDYNSISNNAATASSAKKDVDVDGIVPILRGTPEFSESELSDTVLQKLIQQSIIVKLDNGDPDIYTEGKPESFCVVIISGALHIADGNEVYEKGAGSAIGLKALKNENFVPEFTVSVHEPTTIIKISKRGYTASIQATLFERGGDPENMFEDDF